MVCPVCASAMQQALVSTSYGEGGLPGVQLRSVHALRCIACSRLKLLVNRTELHRAIAARLVRKPFALTAEEVRFLRRHLGCSNDQFARCLGVSPETASRWASATGHARISPTADRLLRLIVAMRADIRSDPIDVCTAIGEDVPPAPIVLVEVEGRWVDA